jgi:hypothetical protein
MESPREAAQLMWEMYGDKFFKEFSFTFRSDSLQPFIKFAKIFKELIQLVEIEHSAINDELFNEKGKSRILCSGFAYNFSIFRMLIERGEISPDILVKFLKNKPPEVQAKYLKKCHQEIAAQVRALL